MLNRDTHYDPLHTYPVTDLAFVPKPLGKHYDPYFATFGITRGIINDFGLAYREWCSHWGTNAFVGDW